MLRLVVATLLALVFGHAAALQGFPVYVEMFAFFSFAMLSVTGPKMPTLNLHVAGGTYSIAFFVHTACAPVALLARARW